MSSLPGIRDPETGAFSREYFDEVISREIEWARRRGKPLSVLSILIANWDALAAANPGAASSTAASLASLVKANLRETDFVFRWQADELIGLLVEADLVVCKKKVELFGMIFRPWRDGRGPIPTAVRVRLGASTMEEGIEFAGVLQAARAAARNESGERPVISVPLPA